MINLKTFLYSLGVLSLFVLFTACPVPTTPAVVVPATYSLTANAVNGSVAVSPSAAAYESGSVVSITAAADSGFKFLRWEGDFDGTSSIVNPASVTMNGNKTVTAVFTADSTEVFPVLSTADPVDGGTVKPAITNVVDGDNVTLSAVPADHYRFVQWIDTDNGNIQIGTSETLSLTGLSSARNISAVFELIPLYTVNAAVSPDLSYGTVSPGSQIVEEGSDAGITAVPATGYVFSRWMDGITELGTDNPLLLSAVVSDRNITAEFERESWTVLVHFAVDNDIDYNFENNYGYISNYISTLESIESGDINDKINIVVLMDSYNDDTQGTGYSTTFQDGYYHLTGGAFADDLDVSITEVNSGDIAETQSFMDWAVTNYPGSNYMYTIFNHGGGFDDTNTAATYGIGFDDSHDDALSHYELGQTSAYLKGLIGKNIDLFYTYACLMGGMELAYEVRDNADYLLFSEELFPAENWSYEALESITSIQGISGRDLGTAFCDSAYNYFAGNRAFTLSLINLSSIAPLYSSIDSYAQAAISDIGSSDSQAALYNSAAEGSFLMDEGTGYYMDLGDYLSRIEATSGITPSVKAEAESVNSAITNAVVYQRESEYPNATGITIFHNIWNASKQYPVSIYGNILTFAANSWTDYLTAMENLIILPEGDNYEPDDTAADATLLSVGATAQDHTIHISGDEDYVQFDLTAGTWYKVETYSNGGTDMDTELYLYDSLEQLIGYNDDSNGLYSSIIYECPASDVYFAKVGGLGTDTGDYAIDIVPVDAPVADSYEPDNDPVSAGSIILDEAPQNHSLTNIADIDFLSFSASAGQDYTIQVTGPDILDMYLYAEGDYVNSLDSGYSGSNINFSCTVNGTYYIKIVSYSGGTGDYTIELGSGTYTSQFYRGRDKIRLIK